MNIQPIRIPAAGQTQQVPVGRVPLFYIGDTEHTIPVDVPGSLSLQALEQVAEHGEAIGTRWLMIQVLGDESYQALVNCKEITKYEMAQIQKVIRELVFGEQEEEGKG